MAISRQQNYSTRPSGAKTVPKEILLECLIYWVSDSCAFPWTLFILLIFLVQLLYDRFFSLFYYCVYFRSLSFSNERLKGSESWYKGRRRGTLSVRMRGNLNQNMLFKEVIIVNLKKKWKKKHRRST